MANAKALVFAGLFFQGKEAQGWLAKGLNLLAREAPEQMLSDGGHFERSPLYHTIILEDLLDLLNLTQVYPGAIQETVGRMRVWLQAMCHPDGEIGFFNDATLGMAPVPAEIFAYGDRLGCGEFRSEGLVSSGGVPPHSHLPPLAGEGRKNGRTSPPFPPP